MVKCEEVDVTRTECIVCALTPVIDYELCSRRSKKEVTRYHNFIKYWL